IMLGVFTKIRDGAVFKQLDHVVAGGGRRATKSVGKIAQLPPASELACSLLDLFVVQARSTGTRGLASLGLGGDLKTRLLENVITHTERTERRCRNALSISPRLA